jgi:uncharacterized repeat protein (TIGR01451 family)
MAGVVRTTPRACRVSFAIFSILAGLFILVAPTPASAQISVSKRLCGDSACTTPLATASLGIPYVYQITITNAGPAVRNVRVVDTLPPGFQLTGTACGPPGGPMAILATSSQIANLPVPGNGGQLVCELSGFFTGAATGANNQVQIFDKTTDALLATGAWNSNISLSTPLPIDLAVTKTASISTLDISGGPQIVTYIIRVKNVGQSDAYLASMFALEDRLSLLPSSVVLNATLVGATCAVVPANSTLAPASDCLNPVPVTPPPNPLLIGSTGQYDLARWRFPSGSLGLLRVGDEIVLTVQVRVSTAPGADCVIVPGGDGFIESAHLTFNLLSSTGQPTALVDQLAGNNIANVPLSVITGATQVNNACNAPFGPPSPVLQIEKRQISPFPSTATLAWAPNSNSGSMAIYHLRINNLSNRRIRNIHLRDVVHEAVGTPPFTATYLSDTCPAAICTARTGAPPQQLPGYGTVATVFDATLYGGTSLGLAPNGTANFLIRLRYSDPRCDSLPDGNVDRIDNRMQILSWEEVDTTTSQVTVVNNQILQHQVTTLMQEAPRCPLVVTKARRVPPGPFPPANRIDFNQPFTYDVTFSNPTATQYVMGTLIDTLRFTAPPTPAGLGPYAIQLQVDYHYTCVPNSPGSVTGYPQNNLANPANNTVYAVASTLPQQGVRLIQNTGPVTFNANSSLVCAVTVIVRPPAATDPNCSIGLLDNAAILDLSPYYNANLPWPSSSPPGMWAHVTTPLPRCYNWVINKTATPAWTWQGGGPLSWTYSVTNAGPPQTSNGPLIRDQFSPVTGNVNTSVDVTSFSVACTNPATPCASTWLGPNPAAANPGATTVQIPQTFATGQTLAVTLNVQNAPMSVTPPSQICNNVSAYLLTNLGDNSYWKNPQTLASQACIPVLATAPLRIRKQIVNPYNVVVPQSFEVTVTCAPYPLAPSTYQVAGSGPATTIQHVPVGDQCSVTETPPPPLQPRPGCAFPVWETTRVPAGPITIVAGTVNQVSVINRVRCLTLGTLVIRKNTIFPAGSTAFSAVTVNVSCSPYGPARQIGVNSSPQQPTGQVTLNDIPVGSVCTVTEELPPDTVQDCGWTVFRSPLAPVTVPASGMVHVNLSNRWICTPGGVGLRIVKRTWVDGQPAPTRPWLGWVSIFPAQSFPVTVTCGGGVHHVLLNPSNNYEAPVGPIAAGSVCTVEEVPPPFPMGDGCVWAPFYTPGLQILYVSGQVMVDILNRQYCNGQFPL